MSHHDAMKHPLFKEISNSICIVINVIGIVISIRKRKEIKKKQRKKNRW